MLAYAKSLVALILGALVPTITAAVTHNGTLTTSDLITAAVTALVSGGAVFGVKNKTTASGIVVTLKTDADKFLSVLLAGLPALVTAATQAALTPSVPVASPAAGLSSAVAGAVYPTPEPAPPAPPSAG